jgi:hypothetical protein
MKNHLCHVAQARCEKQTILIADSQWNLITVGGIGLVDWRLPPNCSCPSQLIFIEAAPAIQQKRKENASLQANLHIFLH